MRVLREFDNDVVVHWLETVDESLLLALAGSAGHHENEIPWVDDDEQGEIEAILANPDCWVPECTKTINLS